MAKLKHQGNFATCLNCKEYMDFWSITKSRAIAHIRRLHEQSINRAITYSEAERLTEQWNERR